MSLVRILVSYDGEWVESPEAGIFKFNGSKGKGMLVPKTIKYQELLDKVCRLLMVDPNKFSLSMKVLYTSSVPVPPAEVVNDDDVNFFIGENSSSNVSLRTPLCVTLVQKSSQQTSFGDGSNGTVNIATETLEHVHGPITNLYKIEENVPVFSMEHEFDNDDFKTSSAELVSGDVSVEPQLDNGNPRSSNNSYNTTVVDPATPTMPASDKSHSVQHPAQENPVEWVTTREDLAAIKTDAVIARRRLVVNAKTREEPLSPSSVKHSWELGTRHVFPTKKELQEKISILAIKEKFEFKVRRSSKKTFHVKCLEEGCEWQLRAAMIRNSTSFQIRKFVKDHSCSKKARGKVHRQATSWVIGQHIKSKCQGSSESYTPREIIEDIQKELGLNLSYEKAWRAREKALYSDGATPRPYASKAGRPKKLRIELCEVERVQNNCGICGELGHNRKTCPAQTKMLENGSSGCAQETATSIIQEVELEHST